MTNLARTPKSAIFGDFAKGGPRENAQKSRPTIRASKTPWRKWHHLLISMHLKGKHRTTFCVLDAIFRPRSIRSSVRARTKSVPFPDFPSTKKTWPTKYDFGLLSSRTALCDSANRSCHKLLSRTTTCPGHRPAGHRNCTQTAIDLSSVKCIIHEALEIFRRKATPAPNKPQILLSPKATALPTSSANQHLAGRRQTHSAEVMRKKTASDLAPGST